MRMRQKQAVETQQQYAGMPEVRLVGRLLLAHGDGRRGGQRRRVDLHRQRLRGWPTHLLLRLLRIGAQGLIEITLALLSGGAAVASVVIGTPSEARNYREVAAAVSRYVVLAEVVRMDTNPARVSVSILEYLKGEPRAGDTLSFAPGGLGVIAPSPADTCVFYLVDTCTPQHLTETMSLARVTRRGDTFLAELPGCEGSASAILDSIRALVGTRDPVTLAETSPIVVRGSFVALAAMRFPRERENTASVLVSRAVGAGAPAAGETLKVVVPECIGRVSVVDVISSSEGYHFLEKAGDRFVYGFGPSSFGGVEGDSVYCRFSSLHTCWKTVSVAQATVQDVEAVLDRRSP